MGHFSHHAADRGGVGALDHLVQAGKSQPFDDFLVLHRRADRRPHLLEVNLPPALLCFFRCHSNSSSFVVRRWSFTIQPTRCSRIASHSSSAVFPRSVATSSLFFSFFSASKVALITLCGLVVPIDFVSTF